MEQTDIEVITTTKIENSKQLVFLSLTTPFFYSTNPSSSKSVLTSGSAAGTRNLGESGEHVVQWQLESSAWVIPHPSKAFKGGEDAHFITSAVVGVADGVGGWSEVGVDPALYANKLMEGAKLSVTEHNENDPLKVLQHAYEHAKDVTGSSTACIVSLENEVLRGANLGDSGFLIIRKDKVIFRTKEQQHSFNFPFQLGTQSTSLPEHADIYEIDVEEGDIIILGTDGLFDNVFDEEILDVCTEVGVASVSHLSHSIANLTSKMANHKSRLSPFAKAAQQSGHLFFSGGKLDDITVLVAKVVKSKQKKSHTMEVDSNHTTLKANL